MEDKEYTLANLTHTAMVAGTIVGYLMTKFDKLGFQIGNFNSVRGQEPPYRIEITYPNQGFGILIVYEVNEQISSMGINTPDEGEEFDPYITGCRWKAQQIMDEVTSLTGGKMIE